MRRAGRRQTLEMQLGIGCERDVFQIEFFGHRAVEKNLCNVRVCVIKRREIIHHQGGWIDVCVEAAGARTRCQHIPHRNTGRLQYRNPGSVSQFRLGTEQIAHDHPEGIARMRIILPRA